MARLLYMVEPTDPVGKSVATRRQRLIEVALLFLRLGFTAFGGPAVHAALFEDEVVHRRKWIDRRHFLDLLAAVNFIPGPNSTELAIHLGMIRAGPWGLVLGGVCFIVPAVLIILPIGWLYVTCGHVPQVASVLVGIRAAMIAVVASAFWRFARTAVRDRFTLILACGAGVAGLAAQTDSFRIPQAELIILAACAVAGAIWYARIGVLSSVCLLPLAAASPAVPAGVYSKLIALALFMLKVGATLFGSGYVLLSYLQGGLVEDRGWLTPEQLTDAIAVGQITPGPLLTTATFVGFVLGHQWSSGSLVVAILSAVLSTVAIFAPSFFFVAILGPFWTRVRNSRLARGALDGMNAAVVALILVVCVALARQTLVGAATTGLAVLCLAILLLTRVNPTWVIAVAAVVGWLVAG